MQVVWVDGEVAFGSGGGDMEFAPECVDVLLLVGYSGELHQVVSCCGVGAVSANEEVEFDFDLW